MPAIAAGQSAAADCWITGKGGLAFGPTVPGSEVGLGTDGANCVEFAGKAVQHSGLAIACKGVEKGGAKRPEKEISRCLYSPAGLLTCLVRAGERHVRRRSQARHSV